MKIGLSLLLSIILISSEKISEVDYKGVQKPLTIIVQKFSPAFAALEDSFEINTTEDVIKSFQNKVTVIRSGEPEIKVVKLEGLKIRLASQTKDIESSSAMLAVTKKVASATKSVLDKTFTFEPIKIKARHPELALNKNIDGVDFVIGKPSQDSEAAILPSNNLLSSAMQNVIQSSMQLDQKNIGPISVTTNDDAKDNNQINIISKAVFSQKLKGQIVLAGGAVYPGENFFFHVQRVFDGLTQDIGTLNPFTGEFEITIRQPRGKIGIELRHNSGTVIAYGEKVLTPEMNLAKDFLVKVYPSDDTSLIGQVLSYESFDDHEVKIEKPSEIYIDGESTTILSDNKGQFDGSKIAMGSQVLVSAGHKGYWNSLQIAESGKPIKAVLHSDKHMKAFLSLIEPYLNKATINSVIWGRVSDHGRPISGAKVSLHGFEDIQPLYFSFRIPDPTLESTSADGFFAFVNPPEGLHIIKSNLSSIPLEAVAVRMDHTSVVNLQTAVKKEVGLYSYDAFEKNKIVSSRVSVPGMELEWQVGSNKKISTVPFFDTSTSMIMDVVPQESDYVPTRYFIGRRSMALNLPQFKKSWLNSILAQQKVNQLPNTSNIIGWVENGSYDVSISPNNQNTQIIYFNKNGEVTPMQTDGGGYLVANAPQGVTTTTLKDKNTGRLIKRISMSEPYRLSVNYFSDLN